MQINEYLKNNNISQVAFSKTVKTGHIYLNAIVRGRRTPSPPLALRISEATGGAVTVMELLFPTTKGAINT
ncbi:MAG: hypothetical protein CVU71_03790 [Deltaproteobacteria bacterium HGW-Deltaproteobacteria-6]|nr:MAG: hypothetical protein CVU71_03790 [Deltaproteobacteria bacterium HGW-Deltaproteobacteria-6]